LAAEHEERLEWIASIHPYRGDGIEALDRAVEQGARAVKWLPSAMGIDPSSSLCDRFYKRLAQYDLPLLTHAGDEQAVAGVDDQRLNNPLLLRRALDHGVRVIVAHCATMGVNRDVDRGPDGPESENFSFFERMMDEPRYENVLFGDISGITQINRIGRPLKTLLSRREWHKRLLYGSDHPLPGVMPLFSMPQMVSAGFISDHDARILSELRRHNPMLFAFALAHRLQWQGQRFSREVFETRRFFTREA
jgi:mannonate dehydratase